MANNSESNLGSWVDDHLAKLAPLATGDQTLQGRALISTSGMPPIALGDEKRPGH